MPVTSEMQSWETASLPGALRWEAWRDSLDATHLRWALEPRTNPADFDAALSWRESGDGLSFVTCRCQPCAGRRQSAEIRATDSPSLGLLLVVEGREAVRQGELSVLLGPGDLFLWDSDRPLDFEVRAPLSKITLMIPKTQAAGLLRRGPGRAPLHLSASQAEASLLAGYMKALAETIHRQEAASWRASQRLVLDLLTTAVTAGDPSRTPGRGAAIRMAVEADIRGFARDPVLSPGWLAGRQGVSTRYLHMLFEDQPQSLAELIRNTRLEGAGRELIAALPRGVSEIAYDWGFNSPAHFSRCFKARYGLSPSDWRARAGGAS